MAQNITLMGASYSDVPAVTLPKTGGGTAQFDDTTDANATASDIASGKTAYVNGQKITGTGSGGGGILIDDTTDSHGGVVRTITAVEISGTKTITSNGTGIDVTEYAAVDVAVPSSAPTLETIEHVQPAESSQTITPDTGYDALSSVQIDPISSSYVGSGITRRSSTDLTASGDTVTVPAGYYGTQATKAVAAGTAGVPTASKGTVSNHAVTVTPSVSNTAGYISGGNKTGTGVTVSASELVSGSETKTANGTYDVTNLAELVVNVSGSSAKTATGTFTGDGSRDITFSCEFEPDVIYWTCNPGTTSSSGVVAGIIARDMMAAARYRNNSTSNSHYAMIDITGMNTNGSSYSFRATYNSTNTTVTLYSFSSNARTYFVNGRTYSYKCVKYTS